MKLPWNNGCELLQKGRMYGIIKRTTGEGLGIRIQAAAANG